MLRFVVWISGKHFIFPQEHGRATYIFPGDKTRSFLLNNTVIYNVYSSASANDSYSRADWARPLAALRPEPR
jgi:hypothetical protein